MPPYEQAQDSAATRPGTRASPYPPASRFAGRRERLQAVARGSPAVAYDRTCCPRDYWSTSPFSRVLPYARGRSSRLKHGRLSVPHRRRLAVSLLCRLSRFLALAPSESGRRRAISWCTWKSKRGYRSIRVFSELAAPRIVCPSRDASEESLLFILDRGRFPSACSTPLSVRALPDYVVLTDQGKARTVHGLVVETREVVATAGAASRVSGQRWPGFATSMIVQKCAAGGEVVAGVWAIPR